MTPTLPEDREGSLFQRVYSGPGGNDPYSGAVSDVYQDLFHEGSFTGKGIYDVDAFEAAMAGKVPDNSILSHDLFEGVLCANGACQRHRILRRISSLLRRGGKPPSPMGQR